MSTLRGLFDEQVRLEKLTKKPNPLERLSTHIDFEFFRKPLEKFMDKANDRSKGGRPSYDAVELRSQVSSTALNCFQNSYSATVL
ncbi:MAG: hypothetical protein WKF91_15780 [Segetibacter sp.]